MDIETTGLDGLLILKPRVFSDERGAFLETFNEHRFQQAIGEPVHWVQDNESVSKAGVLRGLHFQATPHAQAKLVRVVRGAVLDVCVDIRPESRTFGRHFKMELDGHQRLMLYIPTGFAHGFLALEDDTVFTYKCSAYYDPPSERTIRWDDPELGIDWGVKDPRLSPKDVAGVPFRSNAWR
ncbi:MAG: dTDP-4-dehydrorhamnose 3,5-epimerase [Flavobacteriales bacterium]|nr:dTDP-4-dehydrorhamnose 3,5-epimerase [Flavobacteriales bacterium]